MKTFKRFPRSFLPITLIVVFGIWGCGSEEGSGGGSNGGSGQSPELSSSLGASMEDISAQDLMQIFGEGTNMKATAADGQNSGIKTVADSGVNTSLAPPPPPPPASPWWFFLMPQRHRARDEVRHVMEAPIHLFHHTLSNPGLRPPCVTVTNSCPLDPSLNGDTCTTQIDFGNTCPVGFMVGNTLRPLVLGGMLEHSAQVITPNSGGTVWDGIWRVDFKANTFRVLDPSNGKEMTYDGIITSVNNGTSAILPYLFNHRFEIDVNNNPMTLVDSDGNEMTTSGVREVWVRPGSSLELSIDTYPVWTPAGQNPFHLHRDIYRSFTRSGNSVELNIAATITQLDFGHVLTRTGSYSVYRHNPTKVEINGTGTLIHFGGHSVTVELQNVVRDLNRQVPVSGVAIMTFDNRRVFTITFNGGCSLLWQDNLGNSGQINLCQRNSFQE